MKIRNMELGYRVQKMRMRMRGRDGGGGVEGEEG